MLDQTQQTDMHQAVPAAAPADTAVNGQVAIPPNETIQEALERIEDQLGIERDTVRVLQARWSQLMREGVLMTLHIGRWRAQTQLNWGDLGLKMGGEEAAETDGLFNLGVKRLLPAKLMREADSIDSAARIALARLSYRTHWGHFVPATAYAEVRQVIDEYRTRYMELRDRIVGDYDQIVTDLRQAYYRQAIASHSRLVALTGENGSSPDEWATNFANGIVAQIPSKEQIRSSFIFDVELTYIPLPDMLAQEEAAAQAIQEAAAVTAAEHEAELAVIAERERTAAYEEEARRQVAYAEVRAAESAAQAKERLMRQMHQDVIAEAQRKKEEVIDGFLADIRGQLHSLIHDACLNVLAALEAGKLHGRHMVQLQHMIETVGALNFFGDKDAEATIRRVRAEILPYAVADVDRGTAGDLLRQITTVTRQQLIGLGQRPSRVATVGSGKGKREMAVERLGVPDKPDEVATRQARIGLRSGGEIDLDGLAMPVRKARIAA